MYKGKILLKKEEESNLGKDIATFFMLMFSFLCVLVIVLSLASSEANALYTKREFRERLNQQTAPKLGEPRRSLFRNCKYKRSQLVCVSYDWPKEVCTTKAIVQITECVRGINHGKN